MTSVQIHDVTVTDLRIIADERGSVMHMLRADAPHFEGFGEIYFSTINPGVAKGWKRHREMMLSLAVPSGRLELVIHDDREDSPTNGKTQRLVLGRDDRYALVTVPPMLWTGFRNIGTAEAILANCASIMHDPGEANNRPLDDPAMPDIAG